MICSSRLRADTCPERTRFCPERNESQNAGRDTASALKHNEQEAFPMVLLNKCKLSAVQD